MQEHGEVGMSVQAPVGGETRAEASIGRRREALLRRASEGGGESALTMADVHRLRGDRSVDGRCELASKFGRQLDELMGGANRDLCTAILHLLVKDLEAEVRRALSESVSTSLHLPFEIASRLARDAIEVARPILESSPVLTDDELVDIVRTNAMQYALAVAGRESVSEALSDALVDTGEQQVVVRVVGNTGAKLSNRALQRITEDYRNDREVQDRLVRRPELPYELVEQLVGVIGDRLEWELIQSRRITPDQARHLVRATRERATISVVAKDHGDQSVMRHLRRRQGAADLDHDTVLGFLRDGDISSFENALALFAGLDVRSVRRLIYSGDRRQMAAVCIKAGLPTAHYIALRMALELAEQCVSNRDLDRGYAPDTMRFIQGQYERLKQEPDKVEELLDA
jgi:uncharacterized protein (DUF2336 family)